MSFYSKRASEGGSLITFLVVGVVLAALVVGGIYTISRRDNKPQPSPAASTKSSPSPTKSVAVSNTPKATPSKSQAAPSRAPASPTPKVTPKVQPSAPKAEPLPATGPSEDIVSISMLGIFVGILIAYVRSAREWRLFRQVD